MEYLRLGKIIDAFSLDGTLKILSSSYFSEKRYQKGNVIYLVSPAGERIEAKVEGEYLVVKLPHLSTYAVYGTEPTGNNIWLYVGIGAGALVLIGAAAFILLKGKKKKAK